MLELSLKGSGRYYGWMAALTVIIGIGLYFYLEQLGSGLGITGMSRDVTWGFYMAQFTFLVGIAASAVMLTLPYYLHRYQAFGRMMILGEFLAVTSMGMCLLFIFVDLGQPMRVLNVLRYPTPSSLLFWDMIVLCGYLLQNLIIGWRVLEAERNAMPPPKWIKPLIYISIPWAVSIHTITAFLYCGLPGRGYWLTAVLAPRFLASAFASGPAFLILLCLLTRRLTAFDPGREQIQTLSKITAYAIVITIFFFLCEIFVVFYSKIPEPMAHFKYLYFGLQEQNILVPWMRSSVALMVAGSLLLIIPATRRNEGSLAAACAFIFIGTWIDKGIGTIVGGFVPSPLHDVTEYVPTPPELMISLAVWAAGLFLLTVLFKLVVSVKEEVA